MPRNYTPRVALTCAHCGRGFTRTPSAVAAGRGTYCKTACKNAAQSNAATLTCETCGGPVRRKRSAVRDQVFCSINCRAHQPPAPAIISDDGLTARVPLQARDGSITGYTIVDVVDVAWVQQWRWQLSPSGRAIRGEKGVTHYLHRDLLGVTDPKIEVDHWDLDPLNNRRSNFRILGRPENAQNLPVRQNASSAHRGVSWVARRQKWWAYCNVGGKRVYSEFFETEQEAADAARAARARYLPYATN